MPHLERLERLRKVLNRMTCLHQWRLVSLRLYPGEGVMRVEECRSCEAVRFRMD